VPAASAATCRSSKPAARLRPGKPACISRTWSRRCGDSSPGSTRFQTRFRPARQRHGCILGETRDFPSWGQTLRVSRGSGVVVLRGKFALGASRRSVLATLHDEA
jgi:hypothetical protein